MINEVKMDSALLELGHNDFNRGTAYLRLAIRAYRPGMSITKELYPAIAKAVESTPARVERAMRHSIERAWERGSADAQLRFFGYSVNPNTGKPTNSEFVARMARICHDGLLEEDLEALPR